MTDIDDCPASVWRLESWSPYCGSWIDISDHSTEAAALHHLAQRRDVDRGPSWLSRQHRLEDARARYRIVRFDAAAVSYHEPDRADDVADVIRRARVVA